MVAFISPTKAVKEEERGEIKNGTLIFTCSGGQLFTDISNSNQISMLYANLFNIPLLSVA